MNFCKITEKQRQHMFSFMKGHGPWIFGTQYGTCFLNICCFVKKTVRKCSWWIKFVHFVTEVLHYELIIFFPPSTMWLVQSQIDTTTNYAFPHIASMFPRGIRFMVAPSPIQLSPKNDATCSLILCLELGIILEHPSNTPSLLVLLDNAVGKEIYNEDIE